MPWDLLSLAVGLVLGGLVVGIAVEAMGRARAPERPAAKLTSAWRLTEFRAPTLVARDVGAVELPADARVLASGAVDPDVVTRAQVRMVPAVAGEFAVDADATRALLFLGGVRPGTLALMSAEPELVSRLAAEARALQDRGSPYLERRRIAELAGRDGAVVETEGHVADVLPFRERFMIRLVEGEQTIGVVVDKDPQALRDSRIIVRGTLGRDRTGYAVIEAKEIRRL